MAPPAENVLTHRVGPFPVWLWGLLAVGAYLLFFHKKSAASTSSTGTVSSSPQTETLTYPTGASYSGPVGYAPSGGGGGGGTGGGGSAPSPPPVAPPTPGNAPTTPGGGNSGLAGGSVLGGGTLFPMGAGYSIKNATGKLTGGTVAGSTGGLYSTIPSYGQTVNLLNSGTPVYYQTKPGQFAQVTSATQLAQIEPAGAKGGPTDTTTYIKG